MSNRLIHEKSPYLLQHAENPVDWFPWGEEAFAKAKLENKPVFLSIGYSSCHWCHVMERESFEDPSVAAILNDHFISIKVDREERPDIDQFYMDACMAFSGHGGWPLSAFLDHARLPFFMGTYFPKDDHMGGLGFMSLLKRIAAVWEGEPNSVSAASSSVLEYMHKKSDAVHLDASLLTLAYEQFSQSFDRHHGGFGNAPKFPSVQNLFFLLRYTVRTPASSAFTMVSRTLDAMSAGGIFDHIGGGFFRYSTDRIWLVPHFEKMLYDQALLLMIYAEAAVAMDGRYAQTAVRTAEFCLREMRADHGGFFTAIDADSEGKEGKAYLWTPEEVLSVLGEAAGKDFCSDYDITPQGNFQGKSIPNRIGKGQTLPPKASQWLQRLNEVRQKRVQPFLDNKILTSSNGLMIAALACAGRLLGKTDWITSAGQAANFILRSCVKNDRLLARWRDGESAHLSTLEDYAYLVWGLLELYQATFQPGWLKLAQEWNDKMLSLFDDGTGGLYLSGKDVTDLPLRQVSYQDQAVPSGNAVAAANLLRLSLLLENVSYQVTAMRILNAAGKEPRQIPMAFPGLWADLLFARSSTGIHIVNGQGLDDMLRLLQDFLPFTAIAIGGQGYEAIHSLIPSFAERSSHEGKAAAYLCDTNGCHPPVTDAQALLKLIRK